MALKTFQGFSTLTTDEKENAFQDSISAMHLKYDSDRGTKATTYFIAILRRKLIDIVNRNNRSVKTVSINSFEPASRSVNESNFLEWSEVFDTYGKAGEMVKLHFFYTYTLEEIGEQYDCSREWVRQVIEKTLQKIKIDHF